MAIASAVQTRDMGVRVEVDDGEPLARVLKRLSTLLHEEGGHPIIHARWHKRRLDCYEKPSILRRRRRWVEVEKRIRHWAPSEDSVMTSYYILELRPRRLWSPRSAARDRFRSPTGRDTEATTPRMSSPDLRRGGLGR